MATASWASYDIEKLDKLGWKGERGGGELNYLGGKKLRTENKYRQREGEGREKGGGVSQTRKQFMTRRAFPLHGKTN